MIIADKLKVTNRAEYLLYMWQVEDLLRVYECDADRIKQEYLNRFALSEAQLKVTEQWYADLCEMMLSEGKRNGGHLQICKNIVDNLSELNANLLHSSNFPYYREMYYKVLPYIVELRSRQKKESTPNESTASELEVCFDLLYGVILLRLQKKAITPQTEKAVKDITAWLGQLSDYYFKDQKEPLDF